MALSPLLVFVGISFVWIFLLTLLFWRLLVHYNKLTSGTTNKTLRAILEELLKQAQQDKKDIDFLKEYCDRIQKEGQLHIQKVGLFRFNPFKDTGGDQSFILSLVDKNNTGVIISGLFSRSGPRWYAKKVVLGKGVEHDLSDEETKALKEAEKINV